MFPKIGVPQIGVSKKVVYECFQMPAGQGASESEASRKRKAAELFQDVELP